MGIEEHSLLEVLLRLDDLPSLQLLPESFAAHHTDCPLLDGLILDLYPGLRLLSRASDPVRISRHDNLLRSHDHHHSFLGSAERSRGRSRGELALNALPHPRLLSHLHLLLVLCDKLRSCQSAQKRPS